MNIFDKNEDELIADLNTIFKCSNRLEKEHVFRLMCGHNYKYTKLTEDYGYSSPIRLINEIEKWNKAGIDLNCADSYGRTPLMYSVMSVKDYNSPSLEIISLLVKSGAELDLTDNDGRTALMLALVDFGRARMDVISLLVSLGADVTIRDHDGNSAEDYVTSILRLNKFSTKERGNVVSEKSLCVVCIENESIIASINCGHKCLCENCSKGLTSCPICREFSSEFIRIYC